MKYRNGVVFFTIMILALVLSACGPCSAPNGEAENLVKTYIAAYEARDAGKTLALFSQDAIYMDQGMPSFRNAGSMYVRDLRTTWAQTFQDPAFAVKFESYFVSADGKSAALKGVYTNQGKDGASSASAPIVILLQLSGGKITREDDYYDSSPFY